MAKTLLIVYHTQSSTCEALTRAAWQGACEQDGGQVRVLRACDANAADLQSADGLLLVAAENSGYLAGGMKEFLDRVFYPSQEMALLVFGLLVSAGNDGRNAEREIMRITSGMPLKLVAEPAIIRGQPTAKDLAISHELAATLAAGLEMGIF